MSGMKGAPVALEVEEENEQKQQQQQEPLRQDGPAALGESALEASGKEMLERIASIFRAFGEPTRLGLLQALCNRSPMSVSELVELSGTSQANVSKHLKVLHEASVLTRARLGNKTLYGIRDHMVVELLDAVCNKLNREAEQFSKVEYSM